MKNKRKAKGRAVRKKAVMPPVKPVEPYVYKQNIEQMLDGMEFERRRFRNSERFF